MTRKAVENVTEAVSGIGSFTAESIFPEFRDLMRDLPDVPAALADALRKLASRVEEEMPVKSEVAEALREGAAALGAVSERLTEANDTFRSLHRQELDQHENPRQNEKAWNAQ